ncbi:prepilin-type N-terminal cleavage/methylation domain-containing protein [Neobacillus sp. 114]|uniref:PulJ/GspJ family protein n=1 Tax=Neobacillus sp. 114 TaxID=3048535 RepID=UPI0024C42EA2|nr:prepilin-type N-terminal cleavage/methylation domain-containing protein [Neobacillus sp. 114]
MKDEKGITLIELLVALSILVIISSLLYGALVDVNKNYRQISERNSLRQDANRILATLTNYHQKKTLHYVDPATNKETYKIKYDPSSQTAYIGQSSANIPLADSGQKIELKVGQPNYQEIPNEQTIDPYKPLYVNFKLIDNTGISYEINTIIKQY